MPTKTRIFLAHASEDKQLVREIHSKLEARGFKPWLDEIDLLPGQNWQVEIPKAIRESDAFVACLSWLSVSKQGYVQREFRSALNVHAEKPPGSIYLIPLKLDNCEVPDFQLPQLGVSLRDIQWLDYWRPDGFDRLVKAIEAVAGHPSLTRRELPYQPPCTAFLSGNQMALLKEELNRLIEIDRELMNNKEDTLIASANLREWKKRVTSILKSDDVYKIEPDDERKGRGAYGGLRNTMKKCRRFMEDLLNSIP